MIRNYRDVEPVSEKDPDVIELAQSFLKMGVLQPALLRPKKGAAGKYQLIFGHRRYVACKVAKLEMIPSNIQEVADDDILELQVTENLQRKDVHGMDEATAFRSLIKDKGYTIEDIAARFGKKVEFITHRLKLNDLIPDLQKTFKKNALSIGQAFVICRLKPEDQKRVADNFKENFNTASVWDVQDFINKNVIRQLSNAPFKLADVTLNPKAGACHSCPKRSGANPLLFGDLEEDDRCFDSACFQIKMDAHFLEQLQEIVQTKPGIHIVQDGSEKLPKEVATLLKQMNVTILPNDKWSRYGSYGVKNAVSAKAFYLNGHHRGKIENIYVEGLAKKGAAKGKAAGKRTANDIDLEIGGIKDRQKRAIELDLEKVHRSTLEKLEKCQNVKRPGLKHQGLVDRGIMVFLLLHKAAGSTSASDIRKNLKGIPKEPPYNPHAYQVDYIKKLASITDDDIAYMIRAICLDHYGNKNLVNGIDEDDTTLRLIAEYAGIDLKSIEAAQAIETTKSVERADKRIKALQTEKKELAPVKAVSVKKDKRPLTSKDVKGTKGAAPAPAVRKNHLGQELTNYGMPVGPEDFPNVEDDDDDE